MRRRLAVQAVIAVAVTVAAGYFAGQAGAASRFGNTFRTLSNGDELHTFHLRED